MTEQAQQAKEKQDVEQERCKGCQGKGGYQETGRQTIGGYTFPSTRRVVCLFCNGTGYVAAEGSK